MTTFTSRFHRIIASAVLLMAIVLITGQSGQAQQTTTTRCSIYGNAADCTSNTVDYGAQQQRSYEAGQQVGTALGLGIAKGVQAVKARKYREKFCARYPGATWRYFNGHSWSSGHCNSDGEKQTIAANEFMAHHRDFKPIAANFKAMTAYIDNHNLDPREKKTYERAYSDMKKSGQLELYSR